MKAKEKPPLLDGGETKPIDGETLIVRPVRVKDLAKARARIAQMPAAISGQHGHNATFAVACALHRAGLGDGDAMRLFREFNQRCLPPWSESDLQRKLTGARLAGGHRGGLTIKAPGGPSSRRVERAPVPISKVAFNLERLTKVAAQGPNPKSWRHWLWERSPIRPETQSALSFLKHLYQPGEIVIAFDVFEAKTPAWFISIQNPMDCRVPDAMRRGGRGQGIWFLSNPVDGQWHPNPRQDNKPSCRSEESVTSFRYAVLESDKAPAHLWLGLLVQLPLEISAIYTSGARSLHALVRVDAKSKAEWDAAMLPLKRPLKLLGADPGALSAVRLTRLPGCWRPEKNGFQKLLYLNPNPPDVRLMDLPVRFSRGESLARWKMICPRWNRAMESAI